MKKRTKVIVFTLSMALIATGIAGCDSSTDTKKDIVTSDNSDNENTNSENGNDNADNGNDSAADRQSSATPTINEQVLLDQDGIKITATEYTTDSIWGDGIKLLVENNSQTDYTIGCDALIVNDYMITDLFSADVAAGKKSNETMYLSSSELEAAGIDTVGKLEMYFHAYDSSYNNIFKNVYSEIQTSEYANMDTTPNDAGTELYNQNGIKIVGKTVDENSFWGTAILLYIENTSGENVEINVDNMSVDGFMLSPIFSTTVYNGKKAIDDITLLQSDLEENNITSIDHVELQFHIINAETYTTITDTDAITFSAK